MKKVQPLTPAEARKRAEDQQWNQVLKLDRESKAASAPTDTDKKIIEKVGPLTPEIERLEEAKVKEEEKKFGQEPRELDDPDLQPDTPLRGDAKSPGKPGASGAAPRPVASKEPLDSKDPANPKESAPVGKVVSGEALPEIVYPGKKKK